MDTTGLLRRLRDAIREIIGSDPSIAVAYSGGLDSSVIVAIALEYAKVKCYTCAINGSLDSRKAGDYAAEDRADHVVISLSDKDLIDWVATASNMLGSTDPTRIAYTLPVLCVLEGSEEKCILAGNGADELFGGYAKYLDAENPSQMMVLDLEKMLQEGSLLSTHATAFGKRIGFPFASRDVISFAERTPLKEKIDKNGRKLILRETARLMCLPSYNRPKKAAQYSSGILKEIKRISRKEHLSLSEWIDKVTQGR